MAKLISNPVVVSVNPVENSKTGEILFQLLVEQKALITKKDGSLRAGTLKCRILSDFDAATANGMVGLELPGYIIAKKEVAEYTFTNAEGEELKASHTWELREVGA